MIELMKHSPAGGCGCKIPPEQLNKMLSDINQQSHFPDLVVGFETKDDAAIVSLGNNKGLVASTDFFTPITNDPRSFGQIAAANAISDIYAMGGQPLMALSVLCWPVDEIPTSIATEVINGAIDTCEKAQIPLCGGHSIKSPIPIFGLAVTGVIDLSNLKKNNTIKSESVLILTKPIGTGILSTAEKKGAISFDHLDASRANMRKLNSIGQKLSLYDEVMALTDITGFGLVGHILEMCGDSQNNVKIQFGAIPLLDGIYNYIGKYTPDGALRNRELFKSSIENYEDLSSDVKDILCDPQTNGGLLIAVKKGSEAKILNVLAEENIPASIIGETYMSKEPSCSIHVNM